MLEIKDSEISSLRRKFDQVSAMVQRQTTPTAGTSGYQKTFKRTDTTTTKENSTQSSPRIDSSFKESSATNTSKESSLDSIKEEYSAQEQILLSERDKLEQQIIVLERSSKEEVLGAQAEAEELRVQVIFLQTFFKFRIIQSYSLILNILFSTFE